MQANLTRDEFTLWVSSPATKVLLLQLEIDSLQLAQNWSQGRYNDRDQIKAQGQAEYLEGLPGLIRNLKESDDD